MSIEVDDQNIHLSDFDKNYLFTPSVFDEAVLQSNWRGLYSQTQFVLRLRPDLHRALASVPPGITTPTQVRSDQILAHSTYLHETIHWWQHVGSITGLSLSLAFPAQAEINHQHLREIVQKVGAKKPLKALLELFSADAALPQDIRNAINVVVNNWSDIEFYRFLIINPIKAEVPTRDRYFECSGHSYRISLSAVLWLISHIIDPHLNFLPDPREWEQKAIELKNRKCTSFFYGSPLYLPPLGALEIFEGQARFSQLQNLYVCSGGKVKWRDFSHLNMLSGVYVKAFEIFAKISRLSAPEDLDDPIIAVFLLVCDFAINPGEFFLHSKHDLSKLTELHDPGMRFLRLCNAVAKITPELLASAKSYDKEGYIRCVTLLAAESKLQSPYEVCREIAGWPARSETVTKLMVQKQTFVFDPANLAVRVLVAHFVDYNISKSQRPDFFCWPGIKTTAAHGGDNDLESAIKLFEKHRALFVDGEDGGVYPSVFEGAEMKNIQTTFDTFYSWVSIYELTRQWITREGSFDFSFQWLTSKHSYEELTEWASHQFSVAYGLRPEDFQVLR